MLGFSYLQRELPVELKELGALASDLRWTWSHESDALWRTVDQLAWEKTDNPYEVLQNLTENRLKKLAADSQFLAHLQHLTTQRQDYLAQTGWFRENFGSQKISGVAYFSMEFGLGKALPLYAGGLGILAGDYLKASSDLGVPVTGVGLLYQEGYFRQVLDANGWQQEAYPYNDPSFLPVFPVRSATGEWLKIDVALPGRAVRCRVWQAQVGRVSLYLLDTNDPLNSPLDRGITGKLYGGGEEMRLVQEIVLGVGGWRTISALGLPIDICHLNEGHAAFVTIERARQLMQLHAIAFREALWMSRPGNLFTTHTPVPAGFDTYFPDLVQRYGSVYAEQIGISLQELAGLGRLDPDDQDAPFSMAFLAARTCGAINGVSRLHGKISRQIFQNLFPQWPQAEVPVSHITNGVHVPTWDSPWADAVWTKACGKKRWQDCSETMTAAMERLSDEELWRFDAFERQDLINYARDRLVYQCAQRGDAPKILAVAAKVLDPQALTLGFARRFASYKRPNLLLQDPERLIRIMTHPERPVQLLIAGKAHPRDDTGKHFIQQWAEFVQRPEVRHRAIFLEDYDIALAQELVQGVDLWINTPRRPWEACGTSGMKVLANGGLNLSTLDGWWDEAFDPEIGWALGDRMEHGPEQDATNAEQLYELLENEIVPMFYRRDASGIPRKWVARMRKSLANLAPQFSANRMVRDYVEKLYLPAVGRYRQRNAHGQATGKTLNAWENTLRLHWQEIRWRRRNIKQSQTGDIIEVEICLGRLPQNGVQVQLYADGVGGAGPVCLTMRPVESTTQSADFLRYACHIDKSRQANDYTARIIPYSPDISLPIELNLISWETGTK
ncbi:starch phosphorylase [Malonomonas rubra DSM 5091]|uniref:Starch phosphorylase n=1 Tax=Malonomonas rubra DSM 5091 TaxID=1122189 RepID=A0A1M6FPH7_MALRU|nr:alpha-glucan family phosphorylase [Malonomonas rubra]SHI99631.1 starch phosphorylase [Malonomonas rubra DSM 5091]